MKHMGLHKTSLHPKILTFLHDHGIDSFYPPQEEAIPQVIMGKNLVLSIPTASGKSLVAYITILNKLLKEQGKALYVVPLIALAREKYEELCLFEKLGLHVGLSTGDLDDSDPRLSRYDIIVCTSEKADSLLRHKASWIQSVKVLIIDEIHLIHDPTRGPTLEVLIAHFRALNPQTQIVALSATIQNATELSLWLDATLVQSDWRPVDLKEGVVFNKVIEYNTGKKVPVDGTCKDILATLVQDSLKQNGQVLIFVNTRRSTITVSKNLASTVKPFVTREDHQQICSIIDDVKMHHAEHTSIDDELISCISSGLAFHHAGLSSHQRRIIEKSYKQRLIKCIVATPTLAAGVNIPAQRVIIRDLWRYDTTFGMSPIPVLEYKQQAGRAGRPRYDSFGEALTIAKDEKQKNHILARYIHGEAEPIYSKLGNQAALRMHLLAAIATGFVETIEQIYEFIDRTFYSYQADTSTLHDSINETINFLIDNGFVIKNTDSLNATIFGQRTSSLYIDPLSAVQLRTALEQSQTKHSTEISFLHAICSTPDVRSLYLRRSDGWVDEQVDELKDSFLLDVPESSSTEYEWFLSDMKTALLLNDWIEEKTEEQLISCYSIGPGDIHSIVQAGEWLTHATREFARMYNFPLVPFLTGLGIRIHYGCKKDLLNLISLKGIGRVRARALYKHNLRSINDLRKVSIEELGNVKTIGPRIAKRIKDQLGESFDESKRRLTEYNEEE
ncbi:MAG: DEAD/DEAH box helicase [Candidatus Thermoplasmatota archaeon]|nr:DEAD/DEAH box helicase [Candidatus Thermoplasmatota archaeon]